MTVAVVGSAAPHGALAELCARLSRPWGEEHPLKVVTVTVEAHQCLSAAKVPHRHAFNSANLGLGPKDSVSCVVVDLAASPEDARKPEQQALADLLRSAALDADRVLPLCSPQHYPLANRGVAAVSRSQRAVLARHAARLLQAVNEAAILDTDDCLGGKARSVLVLDSPALAEKLCASPCVGAVHLVLSPDGPEPEGKGPKGLVVHHLAGTEAVVALAQKELCSLACTQAHIAIAEALERCGIPCFGGHARGSAFCEDDGAGDKAILAVAAKAGLPCLSESERNETVLGGVIRALAVSDGASVSLSPSGLFGRALAAVLAADIFEPLVDAARRAGTPLRGIIALDVALTAGGPRVVGASALPSEADLANLCATLEADAVYPLLAAAARQSLPIAPATWVTPASAERPVRLGVLGSTRGTDMQYLIDAIAQGWINAEIAVVVSNKTDAYILQRARNHGIPAVRHGMKGLKSRTEFDALVTGTLEEHKVDLVLLIGYMRILSDEFVARWQDKCLNVHPSLLPEFAGGMDLNVHQEVIDAGKKQTGCTVHLVTTELDGGPIVIQRRCDVLDSDDADTLKARVQALEGPAFVEAIWKTAPESS